MKFYTMAIGAGLGYIAGNAKARSKTIDTFKQLKGSPQAKALESKVSTKANQLTSKVTRTSIDIPESTNGAPTVGGADAVDTSMGSYSSAPLKPDHSVIG